MTQQFPSWRLCWCIAAAFAACNAKTKTYQGWVEANLIFVAPDEAGRVETLVVREGDQVEAGAPLFTVDEQLQRADLNLNVAQLDRWREQTYERAQQLRQDRIGHAARFRRGAVGSARRRGAGEFRRRRG